jgi:hypothetical protein
MKIIELQIYKIRDSFGLTLSEMENGSGAGYRIFGPKLDGTGIPLKTVHIDLKEIDNLILRLESAKKFLLNNETELV